MDLTLYIYPAFPVICIYLRQDLNQSHKYSVDSGSTIVLYQCSKWIANRVLSIAISTARDHSLALVANCAAELAYRYLIFILPTLSVLMSLHEEILVGGRRTAGLVSVRRAEAFPLQKRSNSSQLQKGPADLQK